MEEAVSLWSAFGGAVMGVISAYIGLKGRVDKLELRVSEVVLAKLDSIDKNVKDLANMLNDQPNESVIRLIVAEQIQKCKENRKHDSACN